MTQASRNPSSVGKLTGNQLVHIFEYLPSLSTEPKQYAALSQVNKTWAIAARDDTLWQQPTKAFFFKKRFSNFFPFPSKNYFEFFKMLKGRERDQELKVQSLAQ